MGMSKEQIVAKIRNFVGTSDDKTRRHWYVGITADAEQRLFVEHKVDKGKLGGYTWHLAQSEQDARGAEKSLLSLGYDGAPGGGDRPLYVYAFHEEPYTMPKSQ